MSDHGNTPPVGADHPPSNEPSNGSSSSAETVPVAAGLEAQVFKRNAKLVVSVSGVEIGEVDDFVAATNLLCTQAAEHRRRVVVQVAVKNKVTYLEIDEYGAVQRTTAPTHSSFTAVETTPGLPGAATALPRPAGKPQLDATGSAGGGFIDARPGAHPVASSWRWKLRRHSPTLARAAAGTAVVAAAVALSTANLSHTSEAQQRLDAWESVNGASTAEVRAARLDAAPDFDDAIADLEAVADRHDVVLRVGATTSQELVYNHPLGRVNLSAQLTDVTAAGGDTAGFLTELADTKLSIASIDVQGDTATLRVRTALP